MNLIRTIICWLIGLPLGFLLVAAILHFTLSMPWPWQGYFRVVQHTDYLEVQEWKGEWRPVRNFEIIEMREAERLADKLERARIQKTKVIYYAQP